ncbi:5-methylcytosine rRNA methyltransferase NSUN4 isoform X2 [Cephus cinctus]|uniref:NOL1/NOP2/Sun domain family member 4 n=1 Tax=Cephus cinctus TaxID=211228 RepID=A0AAJ7W2H2_CEPCN|nr:5-methylcytosine rRNA methyltransferase NSUN4 isoform X2 [Cephus cinctus]XP_024941556.1 5-methylcytosine rRNA methyltransferase NSUN4 isoform X2 [Cephus cinctus]XP_024941557.1 5-methylcytosine rRNA methyltransferase NSUN4 isoform X2 [Cephus cinctus]XP_024941558.1 5-methylcytosine rRNA methyltransferase NSUN4 isoform X2 [Cephus cinctus]
MMTQLFNKVKVKNVIKIIVRYKAPRDHWASGAFNLKTVYDVHQENIMFRNQHTERPKKKVSTSHEQSNINVASLLMNKNRAEVQSMYPEDYTLSAEPTIIKDEDEASKIDQPIRPMPLQSIESGMENADFDTNRIINPSMGLSSSSLYEYIPATKIKGLEDWVLESDHYKYYQKGADFTVKSEKESTLNFPKHLQIYTYEENNDTRFPHPKRGSTGVYNYYLLDGGSVLPVLALDLQPGDNVLDMCAAPGGKSLAAIQSLMPGVVVLNDIQLSRVNRINNVLDQYISDMGQWEGRLFVTENDARLIQDKDVFNKILVDVPCTTDRLALHEDDNSMFKSTRLKERLNLPQVQTDILTNALKLVAPGGIVVYSTCSLSPIQNDGVVQMALKKSWEETESVMIVKDMSEALNPLRCLYKFGNFGLRYGHIVIPTVKNNWGPIYFCKIQRIR